MLASQRDARGCNSLVHCMHGPPFFWWGVPWSLRHEHTEGARARHSTQIQGPGGGVAQPRPGEGEGGGREKGVVCNYNHSTFLSLLPAASAPLQPAREHAQDGTEGRHGSRDGGGRPQGDQHTPLTHKAACCHSFPQWAPSLSCSKLSHPHVPSPPPPPPHPHPHTITHTHPPTRHHPTHTAPPTHLY